MVREGIEPGKVLEGNISCCSQGFSSSCHSLIDIYSFRRVCFGFLLTLKRKMSQGPSTTSLHQNTLQNPHIVTT